MTMKKTDFKIPAFIVLLIIFPLIKLSAHKVVITVQNYSFTPASVTDVSVGDTIHWDWVEGSHTTTSTSVPAGAATWNSPLTSANPSFEYKVTAAGNYSYKCTPHAAMGMTGTFTANGTNGITSNSSVFADMQLNPNPARESVNISFNPANSFKGSVSLFNLIGNILFKYEYEFDAGVNRLNISLANIPAGLYFIELRDKMNNRAVRRLIVQ
jgi:plastocyanin